MESKREHYLKLGVLVVYLVLIVAMYGLMSYFNISFRDLGRLSRDLVVSTGAFGPFIMLAVYAVSTIIPFPTNGFAVIAGALFGPWLGTLIAITGVNLTAWISFGLARYFGRHFIAEREKGWMKDLDDVLSERGFVPVTLMRLLFVPSDFVSLGSGLTRMPFKTFVMATAIGTLPGTVLFTLFGESIFNPRGRIVLAVSILVIATLVFVLRRIPAIKKYIPQ
ncbi:MAG: TVP38/TMEM64 family protein [Patescibacteria group bacterium]